MPNQKKPGRPRKKSTSVALKTKHTSKTQNAKTSRKKKTHKVKSPVSTDAETSPFKGFVDVEKRTVSQKFDLDDENLDKNREDVFNSLLDDNYKRNYSPNMKTYANKKKFSKPGNLLEFQDNETRTDVVKWLNDNRNVFDRLTQTQTQVPEDSDTQMTFDMPSVSQRPTSKSRRSTRKTKKKRRNPYNLRARSLDIQVQKNERQGGNRHSIAGDTPEVENYHIEEVITKVEPPVPADDSAKILLDLMEDEYLDNLEKEIMQCEDKKNQSGWDRIRDLNKTINTKKQPKQLKITVHETPTKREPCNNNLCYDYNVFENYFVEMTERLLGTNSRATCEEDVKNVLNMGKTFLGLLQKLLTVKGRASLLEFRPLVIEIKRLFDDSESSATQTNIQAAVKEVQTTPNVSHATIQTDAKVTVRTKSIQTESITVNIGAQNENLASKMSRQVSSASSSTISDIFPFIDREKREIVEENNAFEDDLDFDTEDLRKIDSDIDKGQGEAIKDCNKGSEMNVGNSREPCADLIDNNVPMESEKGDTKSGKEESSIGVTGESVLIVSANIKNEASKGKKRLLNTPESGKSKRPCAKFIDENLSVGFSSCVEENEEEKQREKASGWLDDSDYDECLVNVLTKYERERSSSSKSNSRPKTTTQERLEELEKMITNATESNLSTEHDVNKPTKVKPISNTVDKLHSTKTTTQEYMEGLENLIYNATKCKRPPEQENPALEESARTNNNSITLEDQMDYFEPSSSNPSSPKKVRRSLFNSKIKMTEVQHVFSESMFESENQKTLTKDNVDFIMQGCNEEEEIQKTPKINILEDIILKHGDSTVMNDITLQDEETTLSDTDFVECTPQKPDLSFKNQREVSVLDVTLPPPLEFQDTEKANQLNDKKIENSCKVLSPPRRPLAAINKITSTPMSQKPDSETFLSISPISCYEKTPKLQSNSIYEKKKSTLNQENQCSSASQTKSNRQGKRVLGPFELAQQQVSKFCPLTIIKKPLTQETYLSSTPKQKSILTYVRPSQESRDSPKAESSGKRKPCIACSRVTKEQVIAISSLTNKKLATYSTSFSPRVTHLIVAVNEKNCLKDHTIKFVSAVAAGVWVLNFGWVQECLRKNELVPEKPYEVLDVSGQPGPQKSRLLRKTEPLFKGYKIYAATPFASTTREEVENVVRLLGGTIVRQPEHLLDKNGYICIIVTEARATQDFELYETWLEVLKVVTVDIEWLSRSVGQYQLLSLRPFTLCSDDTIESLGYPSELTANMTYSFSQQTFSSVPSSK